MTTIGKSQWLPIIALVSAGQFKRIDRKTKALSQQKGGAKVNGSLHASFYIICSCSNTFVIEDQRKIVDN